MLKNHLTSIWYLRTNYIFMEKEASEAMPWVHAASG